ncbi:hypothetical protein AQUCO_00200895v1 [Aquilegia coerulea]|uniref:Uncharacterized protein n=1 Tax=Aquilegia coerulea TaxID=218851 RepID=A0A2G5F5C5_AQUCA|nr:hypothetical protein AQUCO_00200895v1 [Aquilegia coerulea]
MAPSHTVKVLELCKIAPPSGTTTQTTLPLTLFDLLWITCPSVEHLLFYEFPHSKTHFTHTVLPHIKHSLSLALQDFFPLCGNLKCSQESNTKPTLSYMEGDSISLTIAESRQDFNYLVSNHVREAHNFHPLVPQLVASDTMTTVLAVQVTLFPKHGICIGFIVHHGIADGNTALQFMRSWSSRCRLKEDSSVMTLSPFYDRSVIKDPEGLEDIYLNDLRTFKGFHKILKTPDITMNGVDMVRTTFILSQTHIKWLNEWLLHLVNEKNVQQFYTSTYVLICAYVIVCLVKARRMYDETKKTIQIVFPTGCRTRLNYPIPATYFGNLIGICTTSAMKCDMIKGEYGFLVACEGIGRAIGDLENGVMQGAEKWVKNNLLSDVSNERVMVAGTLKLSFYEIDFGWGRPIKSEIISLEKKGAFSLAESRDGDGGVKLD